MSVAELVRFAGFRVTETTVGHNKLLLVSIIVVDVKCLNGYQAKSNKHGGSIDNG